MMETSAKRQKVDHDSQFPNDTPFFEDFAPDGDVIFVVQEKTRVRVHSMVMKCASPVFAAMLRPNFKEGRALADTGDVEIDLPEDSSEDFYWICRALHCQAHTMLWNPTLTQLASVWSLVDKYDMKDSMQLSLKVWINHNMNIKEPYCDHRAWLLAVISLANRDAESFKTATRELILKTRMSFRGIASDLEGFTQKLFSESVIWKLVVELQATRDHLATKSTKFVYGDLPNILLGECNRCIGAYFREVKQEVTTRVGCRAFMDAKTELTVVPLVLSAIDEWAINKCQSTYSTCAVNRRSARRHISEFLKEDISGLCLNCFDKQACTEHTN